VNIAVFCSGNGSNLQAIIDAKKEDYLKAGIKLVVSDVPGCYALARAEREGIETFTAEIKKFKSKTEFEQKILEKLREKEIGLIVLAGYMKLLSKDFIDEYKNRILNIHPSLLPSFKGGHGIQDALAYGVKVTGPTVHFVTEEMDAGPVILQSAVMVKENDTEDTLAEAIHREEHKIYPKAIRLFIEGKLKVEGRRVKIVEDV
jgi:phosphoribosylglycinamide formyltransferase 1